MKKITTKEVIEMAVEAKNLKFANYDWSMEAIEAAMRIAAGDRRLAEKIARAANKLPEFCSDQDGVPSPFLWYDRLQMKKR